MPTQSGKLLVPLLNAETVDETASLPVDCSGFPHVTIYVTGTGTTSSGVVTIEEAFIPAATYAASYTGTWSVLTTVNASDVTGGAQKAVHLAVSAYASVRTRISTVIGGGGSVSTALVAS